MVLGPRGRHCRGVESGVSGHGVDPKQYHNPSKDLQYNHFTLVARAVTLKMGGLQFHIDV